MNRAGSCQRRREIELHSKLPELHSDYGSDPAASRGGGNGWKREFAAGQEARIRALDHDQVRLSQNLQQVLLLQRLDGSSEVQIRAEDEKVQQIGEIEVGITQLLVLELELGKERRLELLCRGFAECGGVAAEQVHAKLRQRGAVDASELHLQQNLARIGFRRHLDHVHYFFRVRGGDRFGALGLFGVGDSAGKHHGLRVPVEFDRGVGQSGPEFLAERLVQVVELAGVGLHLDVI